MDNTELLEALEAAAQALPWDRVQLQIEREPQGKYKFAMWALSNSNFGFPCEVGQGETPMKAAQDLLARCAHVGRDPEKCRKAKIEELQKQIAKLQSAVLDMPPYRPNRELAAVNPIKVPNTVDVEGTVTA